MGKITVGNQQQPVADVPVVKPSPATQHSDALLDLQNQGGLSNLPRLYTPTAAEPLRAQTWCIQHYDKTTSNAICQHAVGYRGLLLATPQHS